jgi:hypothetical protein
MNRINAGAGMTPSMAIDAGDFPPVLLAKEVNSDRSESETFKGAEE